MLAALLFVAAALAAQDADALIKSGSEKLARDDFKGAARDFARALEINPRRADACLGLGKAHYKLKEFEAIEDLTRCIVLDPANADAYYWRGVVYLESNHHRLSLRDFTKCMDLGAKAPVVYAGRAMSLAKLAEFEKAEADYNRALEGGLQNPATFGGRGWARLVLQDLRGAISDSSRAILLDSNEGDLYAHRFMAYFGLHSWDNALNDLYRKQGMDGTDNEAVASLIYLTRLRKGEGEAVARELKTRLAPPASDWMRAIQSYLLGPVADDDLLNVAQSNPKLAPTRTGTALFYIGQKHLLAGDSKEAMKYFSRAIAALGRGETERVLAQAELAFHRSEKRRLLLGDLESRFRAVKPFEARFKAEG